MRGRRLLGCHSNFTLAPHRLRASTLRLPGSERPICRTAQTLRATYFTSYIKYLNPLPPLWSGFKCPRLHQINEAVTVLARPRQILGAQASNRFG